MEILLDKKYAIKKLFKKFIFIALVMFIILIVLTCIVKLFHPIVSIQFIFKNIHELLLPFLLALFGAPSVWLTGEFYNISRDNIQIILNENQIVSKYGKNINSLSWDNYKGVSTVFNPNKIKKNKNGILQISDLFHINLVKEKIEKYKKNISKNNF